MKITEARKILENELKRLTIELGLSSSADVDSGFNPYNKRMEAANQATEMEQRLLNARRLQQQVTEIKHALVKINNGTYGVCDECGKSIGVERLKVIPQAYLCLECKSRHNRTLLKLQTR